MQVWNLCNKRSRKTNPKNKKSSIWHKNLLRVVFVFCKWRPKILVNSVFITSGYWEYFSDAEKVLYLFYVRVVHFAGIGTSVLFIQFYGENTYNGKNKTWRKKPLPWFALHSVMLIHVKFSFKAWSVRGSCFGTSLQLATSWCSQVVAFWHMLVWQYEVTCLDIVPLCNTLSTALV